LTTVKSGAAGILTIDLAALAHNWRLLSQRVAPAKCAAVIKANAYGIGIDAAAPVLYRAGCRIFFVAHVSEGQRARNALDSARDATIYVLNGLQTGPDLRQDYVAHGLTPVIGSPGESERWLALNAGLAMPLPWAIHADTGMNRLGFASVNELHAAVPDRAAAAGAILLMSHFVSSEAPEDPLNARQIARFAEIRRQFPDVPASLGNSSALFLPQRPFYDLVRPGYALYGGNPTPGLPNPMNRVVTLEIPIQQTRWIEAGETVGYNAQWTALRRSRLATLLAGYADGLPRTMGATRDFSGAEVVIAGERCPLVGRVSMDLCVADVTHLPESSVAPGGFAQVLGDIVSIDELAERSGTIGYHVLTILGSRYKRVYLDG
jgi:alanine racemase